MKLLNVGCGGQRPQNKIWWNLDNLRTQLNEGTPERTNLDKEPRYVECDLSVQSIPFPDETFDGITLVHVIEHFTCHEAVDVLIKCRRVLKPGGLLLASVPDANYFLDVYEQDTKERAVELFGEPIHDAGHEKFFSYALFRHDHKQILTADSLECLLRRSGFDIVREFSVSYAMTDERMLDLYKVLNRRKFSVEMIAVK